MEFNVKSKRLRRGGAVGRGERRRFCLCDDLPGWLELVDLLVRLESYAKDHVAVV